MHPYMQPIAAKLEEDDRKALEEFSAYVGYLETELVMLQQFEQYVYMSLMGLKESRDGAYQSQEGTGESASTTLPGSK